MTSRTFMVGAFASLGLLFAGSLALAGDFPEGSPKFLTSYSKAVEESKKSGKPLLLVFSATWCGPCQVNKKKLYPAAEVKPLHDKFVWAYLDADDAANLEAMRKYKVEGIPHIQFVDSAGKAIDQVIGGSEPGAFVKVLNKVLAKVPAAPKPAGS